MRNVNETIFADIENEHFFPADSDFPVVTVDSGISADEASLDPLAGGTAYNKLIWTADRAAAYLNRTSGQWGTGPNDLLQTGGNPTVIAFGFHEDQQSLVDNGYVYASGGRLFALSEYFQFAKFNDAQRAATREAIGYWDDIVATTFIETSSYDADINFGNLTNSPNTQAYSRIPTAGLGAALGGQVAGIAGDVWVSVSQASNFQFDEGLYGLNTLVHEIGHSVGLSHPGNYNFGPGFAVNYANGAEYAQDIRNYSIMSYWNPRDVGIQDHDYRMGTIAYGATPMIHDILAVQMMYGADMTTRTGDTTYGFNASADTVGRDVFNFNLTPAPVMAIWDAGGNDTIDASGYSTNQIIDLTPGSLSSIGGVSLADAPTLAQVNANRAIAGYPPLSQASYDFRMNNLRNNPDAGRLVDNVGIAYGAVIENAVGGSGNDTLLGNVAANVLTGNAGNDLIASGAGNDTLNGGTGVDTMLGGTGNDLYYVDVTGDIVTELASEGTDTVSSAISYTLGANLENLVLTGAATSGTGNELGNTITGNANANVLDGGLGNDILFGLGGSDRLFGGAGDDRLIGGDGVDYLTGGAGNDIFVAEINTTKVGSKNGAISLDVILDFGAGDKIDLSGLGDFNWGGNSANKNAGDLTIKTFGNINAAENALGIDIDGVDGPSSYTGPVTMVFGNIDGGPPDFALALIGVSGVTQTDFLF
ncbi:MAG: M10 family metallopeptidase C-terminal domain-containing protein [Sphingomonas bacterium]|nr:M10 family metallopeptidase C-terminal domain-containing protein [Sphingomonas bacterium]